MRVLVVTNPFGGFGVGDVISDPDQIAEIQAGGNAGHVVAANHPDMAQAAPEMDASEHDNSEE